MQKNFRPNASLVLAHCFPRELGSGHFPSHAWQACAGLHFLNPLGATLHGPEGFSHCAFLSNPTHRGFLIVFKCAYVVPQICICDLALLVCLKWKENDNSDPTPSYQ